MPLPLAHPAAAADPLLALRAAEAQIGVHLAELHGTLAGLVALHDRVRHVLAGLETAALPQAAGEEAWREFCDRLYADLIAARPIAGPGGRLAGVKHAYPVNAQRS